MKFNRKMDRVPGLEPAARECPSQRPCRSCGDALAATEKFASRTLRSRMPSSALQQELYHNQELCDVAINVSGHDSCLRTPPGSPMTSRTTVILAHRVVIAAHSAQLRAIFASSPASPITTPTHCPVVRSVSADSMPSQNIVRYQPHRGLLKTTSAASDGADSGHGQSLGESALMEDAVFMSRPIMSIDVDDCSVVAVRSVLDFAYTGNLAVSIDRVEDLLKAACALGFKEVHQLVGEYLSRQPPAVILRLLIAAHLKRVRNSTRSSASYVEMLFSLCEERFEAVATCPELLSTPFELFHALLESHNLVLRSEELVFQAILQWVQHQKAKHPQCPDYLSILIPLVRLPFVSAQFLTYRVMPLSTHIKSAKFRDQLRRAQIYHQQMSHDASSQLNSSMSNLLSPRLYQQEPAVRLIALAQGGLAPSDVPGIESLDVGEDGQPLHLRWRTVGKRSITQHHPAVVVSEGSLYVIGGSSSNRSLDRFQSMDVLRDNGKLTTLPSMLAPRDSPAAVVFNREIYAIGGCTSGQTLDLVERFSFRLKRWCLAAPMSTPRAAAGVATNDSLIFVVGGCVGIHALSSVECYDVQENEWYSLPNMQVPRISPCVAFVDKRLMVFGGHSISHVHCSAEYYDAAARTWRTLANMLVPRTCASCVVLNGNILLAGGHDGFHRLAGIDELNLERNEWRHSPLPSLTSTDGDIGLYLVHFNYARETIC